MAGCTTVIQNHPAMVARTPSDIAREAVKLLTTRKLAPTPENFQSAYHEIAGTRPLKPFPSDQLRPISQALPDKTPGQQRLKAQTESAINLHNWEALQKALVAFAHLGTPVPSQPLPANPAPVTPLFELPAELCEQVARIVEHSLPAVGNDDQKLVSQAQDLIDYLRLKHHEPAALRKLMASFAFRLSFVAEEQGVVKASLLNLMQLIFENIAALSLDNPWLKGQMESLMEAAKPPLSAQRLEELQSRLKDVIHKQAQAKERTLAAQEEMKRTLATFIERLGRMTEDSSHYGQKIELCAQRLERAQDLSDIAPVLQEAIQTTRALALDTRRSSEELMELRDRAAMAESEIARLQQELDRMSEMVRHDALTGALNRKGLEETVEREIARTRRAESVLCVALLDIDNFKKLNDQHGHEVGDAALLHLSQVARECIRPQDSLARYGGEEFVVVMPDTQLEQGVEAMKRLQRELTKRLFLRGNERLLITFSAGVAECSPGEAGFDAVNRADQAMYLAKRAGKNRVVAA
jgi:diguanylate cyclase